MKIPWRRKWQPTPVLLPGKSHGRRSLLDYSPWGCKELDTTERLHFHFWLISKLSKRTIMWRTLYFKQESLIWERHDLKQNRQRIFQVQSRLLTQPSLSLLQQLKRGGRFGAKTALERVALVPEENKATHRYKVSPKQSKASTASEKDKRFGQY